MHYQLKNKQKRTTKKKKKKKPSHTCIYCFGAQCIYSCFNNINILIKGHFNIKNKNYTCLWTRAWSIGIWSNIRSNAQADYRNIPHCWKSHVASQTCIVYTDWRLLPNYRTSGVISVHSVYAKKVNGEIIHFRLRRFPLKRHAYRPVVFLRVFILKPMFTLWVEHGLALIWRCLRTAVCIHVVNYAEMLIWYFTSDKDVLNDTVLLNRLNEFIHENPFSFAHISLTTQIYKHNLINVPTSNQTTGRNVT